MNTRPVLCRSWSMSALLALTLVSLPACKKKTPPEATPPAAGTAAGAGGAGGESAAAGGAGGAAATKPEETPKATAGCALPGQVSADVTLTKGCTLTVKENVTVSDGATLTIEAGVTLSFPADVLISVQQGRLVAKGTAEAPVRFTSASKTPAAGDWVGIGFNEQTQAGTVLEHVVVEYAGRQGPLQGAIDVRAKLNKRISISASNFRNNDQAAIHAVGEDSSFAKFEGNTFEGNKVSLHIRAEMLGSVGPNNKFGTPIEVVGAVETTQTWPAVDVPIIVTEYMQIGGEKSAAILTLPEKATLKFAMSTYIEVGIGNGGGLVAKGVTFASNNEPPNAGDWVGILLRDKATSTVLDGCTVTHAGREEASGKGAVTYGGAKLGPGIKITNTTFKDNQQAAIWGVEGKCGDATKPESKNKSEGAPLCAAAE